MCTPPTKAVSTRPGSPLRFSFLSPYYLAHPLSMISVGPSRLLPQEELQRQQICAELRVPSAPILSVWFRHCHVDPAGLWLGNTSLKNRKELLYRLRHAGISYASYGRCMRNVPTRDPVLGTEQNAWLANKVKGMRRHPFVLVSENSAQPGWVTEKVYQALAAGVVPVWLGTPRGWEEKYLIPAVPPNSVIIANQWPTLEALAKFLNRTANNESLYQRFHQWRHEAAAFNTSKLVLEQQLGIAFETTPCRICQKLHDERRRTLRTNPNVLRR